MVCLKMAFYENWVSQLINWIIWIIIQNLFILCSIRIKLPKLWHFHIAVNSIVVIVNFYKKETINFNILCQLSSLFAV
jgi:hypothetical protein